MRMDPTDVADVTGYTYTYLMNGMRAPGRSNGPYVGVSWLRRFAGRLTSRA